MRAEIIAVLARNGEISQGQLRVITDKLSSVGIATSNIVHVKNLPEMAETAKTAFEKGNMPVFIYSMATRADKAIKNIICQNTGLKLRGSKDCLNNVKRKLAEKSVRYSDEYTYFAVFPDGSKIFENPKGLQNGFLTSASGKAALALPTEQIEIILDEQVLPLFRMAEERAKSREQIRPTETIQPNLHEENISEIDEPQAQEQQEDVGAVQGKVMVGVCGIGRNELIKRLSSMLKATNPKMSVLSRQEDVQITLTATADTKEQINKILNDAISELKRRFGNGVYGINIPDIYCAAAKKLNDNRSKIAIVDPYTRGEFAAGIKKNGFANIISFEENSGTQRTKVNVLGVSEKMIKKKGAVSAEVASAMAAGAKKISGAKVGIAILGVSYGQGDKKLPEGTVFIAIDSEYGSRVKTLNIPEKFTKEQMCKIAAFEAAAQLRLYDETASADNINGKAVNQMGKASSKTSKKAPRSPKKEKKSFGRKLREYFLPMKGDGVADVAKKLILMLALVVFVGSMSYIVYYYKNASGTKEMYDGIKDFVIESNDMVNRRDLPKDYPEKYQPKFVNLWKENRDIAGWIKIDNTIVDYPVVQRPGDKNIYYFRKDFSEKYNKYGVPFVDYETSLSKPSANTIIYGHNMADGQMFGVLEQYKSLDFYKSNPVVDFNSVYKDGKYVIFGAFLAATREQDDPFNYHHFVNPKSDTEYNNFIEEVRKRSFYSVPLDINPNDELLTLSTCTYTFYKNGKAYKFPDGRLVVIARKVRDGEDYSSAVLGASWQNALMPKPYYDIDDSTPAVGEKPLEALTLSEASIQMQAGETKALTYSTTPTKAAKTTLKWSSSDPGVATIDKGKITAIKNGTTTITLSTEDGRISASAKVVVGQPAPTNLEKIYFAKDDYSVQKGESIRLNLKTSPSNFDLSTLKLYYMSNNEDIASISQDGYVTGHKLGRTLITVSTTDGKYSAEAIVNILDGVVNPTGISIDRSGAQFVDGELHVYEDQSIRLKSIITPSGATDTDVVWSTSDKKVISVDSTEDGEFTVRGRIGDKAKITVKTEDGNHSDSIKVRIVEGDVAPVKVTGMTLSPNTDFELAMGDTKQITASVTPSNATDKSVTWSTGNSAIATISSSGVVTAHSEGTTYIKAKANDGSGLTAQVNITVKKSVQEVKVKGVALSASNGTIDVGSTIKLSATISPSNATNKGIKWTSSSDGVATVSGGTVTGKSAGTATITARTDDGGFVAEATITVKKVEKPTVPETPVEKQTQPETPTQPEIPTKPEQPAKPEVPAEKPTVPTEKPVVPPEKPEEKPTEPSPDSPAEPPAKPEPTPSETTGEKAETSEKAKTGDDAKTAA